MPSSAHPRYALRFESGDRKGETVPIDPEGITVGRRPSNGLQVVESSVSGVHAEFEVDGQGVVLRDLNSTNGTRVGAERVQQRRLAHGDVVHLGNVRFTFLDGELAEPAPEAQAPTEPAPPAPPGEAGEAVQHVSADRVARSQRRSIVSVVVVLAVLGAGGFAAWRLGAGGGGRGEVAAVPVREVEGDLLSASRSFEEAEAAAAWSSAEAAPAAFVRDARARRSGDVGFLAGLAPGEWALLSSPEQRVATGRALEARAAVRPGPRDGRARLGLELIDTSGRAGATTAWSEAVEGRDEFVELSVVAAVPPGYDAARVLVLAQAAQGEADVAVDDASLAPTSGPAGSAATVAEYQLSLVGDPPRAATLFKIDRVLLSGLVAVEGGDRAGPLGGAPAELACEGGDGGIHLRAPAASTLSGAVEPALAAAGVATIGPGGYRTHQVEFRREETSSLLLGSGRDLVRLRFPAPLSVSGRPEREGGEAFAFTVELEGAGEVFVQLAFAAERAAAADLAHRARAAEGEGALGGALELWSELLDEYPYEAALVQESEAARSRLIQRGMEELQAVRAELERARFFRLVDLYRECRARAEEVAARYAGSEVVEASRELVTEVEGALAALDADRGQLEAARLASIRGALERRGSERLAAAVGEYLERHFPDAAQRLPESSDEGGGESGSEDG